MSPQRRSSASSTMAVLLFLLPNFALQTAPPGARLKVFFGVASGRLPGLILLSQDFPRTLWRPPISGNRTILILWRSCVSRCAPETLLPPGGMSTAFCRFFKTQGFFHGPPFLKFPGFFPFLWLPPISFSQDPSSFLLAPPFFFTGANFLSFFIFFFRSSSHPAPPPHRECCYCRKRPFLRCPPFSSSDVFYESSSVPLSPPLSDPNPDFFWQASFSPISS